MISARPKCEPAMSYVVWGVWNERKIVDLLFGIKPFLFTVSPHEVFPAAHARERCFLCRRPLKKGEIVRCKEIEIVETARFICIAKTSSFQPFSLSTTGSRRIKDKKYNSHSHFEIESFKSDPIARFENLAKR